MDIADVQRDVRTVYAGGSYGQLVSGIIWLVFAVLLRRSHDAAASQASS